MTALSTAALPDRAEACASTAIAPVCVDFTTITSTGAEGQCTTASCLDTEDLDQEFSLDALTVNTLKGEWAQDAPECIYVTYTPELYAAADAGVGVNARAAYGIEVKVDDGVAVMTQDFTGLVEHRIGDPAPTPLASAVAAYETLDPATLPEDILITAAGILPGSNGAAAQTTGPAPGTHDAWAYAFVQDGRSFFRPVPQLCYE